MATVPRPDLELDAMLDAADEIERQSLVTQVQLGVSVSEGSRLRATASRAPGIRARFRLPFGSGRRATFRRAPRGG
jgi:hypothetical protein